ncbi:hypothetical protein K458DRAFT_434313 [Lentithecium fluviatile CBS 122367]|uniref:Uncharacterized protein n=1 Tax=Lentithecium fluviatile CBS 122367 TaxID=1168545 RepID=A0A6G1IQG9_9PLEO|nr:hypothetical protein K458DRAFT_434313 [Lentithecium fluviatile CBS 122367]
MEYSGICETHCPSKNVYGGGMLREMIRPHRHGPRARSPAHDESPAIFGEGGGYIHGIGSSVKNTNLRIGDAALLSFNACGTCPPCTSIELHFCESTVQKASTAWSYSHDSVVSYYHL